MAWTRLGRASSGCCIETRVKWGTGLRWGLGGANPGRGGLDQSGNSIGSEKGSYSGKVLKVELLGFAVGLGCGERSGGFLESE